MELEEIRRVLHAALPLRIPLYDPNVSPRVRIDALQDHILKVAYHRAELEEALHWTIEIQKTLKLQWDSVRGWEQVAGQRATAEKINAAKRQIAPNVWSALAEAKALTESLDRQIRRLGGSDYDAASRIYSMMSGA